MPLRMIEVMNCSHGAGFSRSGPPGGAFCENFGFDRAIWCSEGCLDILSSTHGDSLAEHLRLDKIALTHYPKVLVGN